MTVGEGSGKTAPESPTTSGVPESKNSQRSTNHTPRNATKAQTQESRRGREAVAPRKTPSQVKAAQPTGGIRMSHGRNAEHACTTAGSEVSSRSTGTPPTQ